MKQISLKLNKEEELMVKEIKEKGFNISQIIRNKLKEEYKKQIGEKNVQYRTDV